ncbi:MAG TPA: hypothetical protein PKA77_17610 [Chitinophagaceae bacterium]|jgi:hypothetical protein|nr:hypothetical protein [Chitinophagaceae bacterium]HMU59968.1 hypothetical protein [Chitinophagaceae bacterium]
MNRLSAEAEYGLNGNFFVRDYEERNSPIGRNFYNKNFIGPIGGVNLKYRFNKKSSIGFGYARSVNSKEVNYSTTLPNNFEVAIQYFNIRHINKFWQLYYERRLQQKKNCISAEGGLFYLRSNQQELDASIYGINFEERGFEHYKLEEAGVFFGAQFSRKIDTKFYLGIKTRVYYTVSTGSLEAITLTPTLSYNF